MRNPLLMMNLLTAVYWFDEALQAALKREGWPVVTRAQSLLFANLAAGEHRASRLARNLGVTRQSISEMLRELENRGLLTTEVDPADRRARIVRFSESSAPLRDAARGVLHQLEAELETRIGGETYRGLLGGLNADWGSPPDVPAASPPSSVG